MVIISNVDIADVQRHELQTEANAKVGGYGMDKYCPVDEFKTYRVQLERQDWERMYLIGEFARFTTGITGRVVDIDTKMLEETTKSRVESFYQPPANSPFTPIDLRLTADLALVIVSADANSSPLILIDGNHRAIAQYIKFGAVSLIPAFLCQYRPLCR